MQSETETGYRGNLALNKTNRTCHGVTRTGLSRSSGMEHIQGPQASLDLTHVLCMHWHPLCSLLLTGLDTDDDSSLFSLALALITLSPILLMVNSSQFSASLLLTRDEFSQHMQPWRSKRGNISLSSCGLANFWAKSSTGC